MLKPQKWTIPSQSGDIEVQFTPHNFSGRHELYIGGNKIEIPRGFKVLRETGGVVEIPFSVDSAEYRFVIYPGKADIVYDGRWLSTGNPYTPPQKRVHKYLAYWEAGAAVCGAGDGRDRANPVGLN